MREEGVRYALAPDGSVADPRTAPKHSWAYRCLVCEEHVHLKKGQVRAPHFAHYAKREVACNPETVLHEAAKHYLVQLLRAGQEAFDVHVPCAGYVGVHKRRRSCPDDGVLERTLIVPMFDAARVEVPLGAYRLDAAATSDERVVLGLEVYQTHEVDDDKRDFLMESGLPWFEVEAEVAVETPLPWRVVRSSFGSLQCDACRKREEAATREQLEWEENLRRAAEERARREAQEALEARITPVAREGNRVVPTKGRRVGDTFTCLVCEQPVTITRVNGKPVFLHRDGEACDPRRAWVRAGMLVIYHQLKRNPEAIRILRHCSGPTGIGDECKNLIRDELPAFDDVKGDEPSLILLKDERPVAQLVFGRGPNLVGAPLEMELRPGRLVHNPTQWWQRRDGRTCPECAPKRKVLEDRAKKAGERRTKVATERKHTVSQGLLRREMREHGQDAETTRRGVEFARQYFAAIGLNLAWAAQRGVIVRRCESCNEFGAFVHAYGLTGIPNGMEAFFGVHHDPNTGLAVTRNRCARCGHLVNNAHRLYSQDHERVLLPSEALLEPESAE